MADAQQPNDQDNQNNPNNPNNQAGQDGQNKPGFGDMTRAWFDAGSEVADYEAGRAAERRRLILAILGVAVAVVGIVALVFFLLR